MNQHGSQIAPRLFISVSSCAAVMRKSTRC
ncbi:hypothetical protein RHECNPAF_770012 [Rhizobium etli CNPAF512]|nr:hypothetical protein RHECNPAF_770012 [Rhizobium etli CNPAF512]